jgi:hypothetical protein
MVLCLAMIIEYVPKSYAEISQEKVPRYAQVLKDEKQVKVVLNYPSGVGDGLRAVGGFEVKNLQNQLVHQKKFLGCYISRLDESYFNEWTANPALSYLADSVDSIEPTIFQDFLHEYKVDVIVVSNHLRSNKIDLFNATASAKQIIEDYSIYYFGRE